MQEIYPPIPVRTNEQLLNIVETKEKWRPEVVDLARAELIRRGIPVKTQETRRTILTKFKQRIKTAKARASLTTFEMVFLSLFGIVLMFLMSDFSLFYKGRGYSKMNGQLLFCFLFGLFFWFMVYYIYDEIKG
jgi:lipopolysaccharide export LptBFGC system permease protein LptF